MFFAVFETPFRLRMYNKMLYIFSLVKFCKISVRLVAATNNKQMFEIKMQNNGFKPKVLRFLTFCSIKNYISVIIIVCCFQNKKVFTDLDRALKADCFTNNVQKTKIIFDEQKKKIQNFVEIQVNCQFAGLRKRLIVQDIKTFQKIFHQIKRKLGKTSVRNYVQIYCFVHM